VDVSANLDLNWSHGKKGVYMELTVSVVNFYADQGLISMRIKGKFVHGSRVNFYADQGLISTRIKC
jgi:hypothetical protein